MTNSIIYMNKKNVILKGLSAVSAVIVWQLLAMKIGMDMLLASPVEVAERFTTIWKEPEFYSAVIFSFVRISSGFLIAFAAGIILGVLAGRIKAVEYILFPYVTVIKTVPIASFIILCLLWLSFSQLTVLIAFLIAFPAIYANVLQGVKSTDKKMLELAEIYHLPWKRRLLYIYMPSVKPYLVSACSVAVGMTWKAGVAAEIIGLVDGSVGEMMYQAKIYFQNADLLCWTIIIIVISVVSEKIFVFLLKSVFRGVEKL